MRQISHAPSVQMFDRPEDGMDEDNMRVPKSGVGDTQHRSNQDKLGGGQAYADANTQDDDEFSNDEKKVL